MRQQKQKCSATMTGMSDPNHTHTCTGDHQDGDHFCGECKRWWWQNPERNNKKESA